MSDKALQDQARAFFGVDDADFSYFTEELAKSDASLGPEAEVPTGDSATASILYGNNARYGSRDINGTTYQVYYFEHGGNYTAESDACGMRYTAWARADVWHHQYLGKCPNKREKWCFVQ